jgi:hypothetical protein
MCACVILARLEATKATIRIHVSGKESYRTLVEPYLLQLGGTEAYVSLRSPELSAGMLIDPLYHIDNSSIISCSVVSCVLPILVA